MEGDPIEVGHRLVNVDGRSTEQVSRSLRALEFSYPANRSVSTD
jgi:hypothetical protein